MRMSLSRRDGLFGDPGADTIHRRGQRKHVTQSVVSILLSWLDLSYIYYYLVWYQVSIASIYIYTMLTIYTTLIFERDSTPDKQPFSLQFHVPIFAFQVQTLLPIIIKWHHVFQITYGWPFPRPDHNHHRRQHGNLLPRVGHGHEQWAPRARCTPTPSLNLRVR